MIITIDGPAGAGKSTVARTLARRLGFMFLDTGAMYRAVTLAAVQHHLDWADAPSLVRLAGRVRIYLDDDSVWLDGDDVTDAIRTTQITSLVKHAANNPGVREQLVAQQRSTVDGKSVVTEGRDQGTVVFPQAELKIFLTAGPEERARRRLRDLQAQGEQITLEEVLAKQNARDASDAGRDVGPLVAAADAVHLLTDGRTLEQVVAEIESLARERMNAAGAAGS
ncbi:MAG: (d)CMP kinase [Pirellulales bacterium]